MQYHHRFRVTPRHYIAQIMYTLWLHTRSSSRNISYILTQYRLLVMVLELQSARVPKATTRRVQANQARQHSQTKNNRSREKQPEQSFSSRTSKVSQIQLSDGSGVGNSKAIIKHPADCGSRARSRAVFGPISLKYNGYDLSINSPYCIYSTRRN